MKTEFNVQGMSILPGGKIIAVGTSHGPALQARQCGQSRNARVEVEITSIGMVDPPPSNADKQMLNLRLLKGEAAEINGATLVFGEAG